LPQRVGHRNQTLPFPSLPVERSDSVEIGIPRDGETCIGGSLGIGHDHRGVGDPGPCSLLFQRSSEVHGLDDLKLFLERELVLEKQRDRHSFVSDPGGRKEEQGGRLHRSAVERWLEPFDNQDRVDGAADVDKQLEDHRSFDPRL